jgi:hypothetical protein
MTETRDEQALVAIPTGQSAVDVFTGDFDTALGPMLKRIREKVDAFEADVTTKNGRDEISSFAYKLSRSKTALDAAGKRVVDDLKALPKKIDVNRAKVRDTLDSWRDEVRAPLTEWEDEEKARTEKHLSNIREIGSYALELSGSPVAGIEHRIAHIEAMPSGPACEEFEEEYRIAKENALGLLRTALAARIQYDKDQAELAALRQAQAERDAKEAQERAEREAKEKAEREAREGAAREAERQAQAERRAADEARWAAEREQARIDREAAEAKLAAERAERQRVEAEAAALRQLEIERQRREREEAKRKAAEEKAAAAREENKAHRGKINHEARNALDVFLQREIISGNSEASTLAQKVIETIAKGDIPHVKIEY